MATRSLFGTGAALDWTLGSQELSAEAGERARGLISRPSFSLYEGLRDPANELLVRHSEQNCELIYH